MKYPPVRLAMPDGVCEWLERELESRGIDAVVYTRYVLSLLRREHHPTDLIATTDNLSVKVSGGAVVRHRRRSSRGGAGQPRIDLDQLRRTAVVDCLASACDQKCGIESLVDELCQKLKDFESDPAVQTHDCSLLGEDVARRDVAIAVDPAARYYAAFPALGTGERNRQQYVLQRSTGDMQHVQAGHFGEPSSLAGDEGYSTNSDHETCDTAAPDLEHEDLDLEYEDLPVDIRGLLASPITPPTPPQRRAQQITAAAEQHRPFIRCGTNITSSIWSQDVEDIVQSTPPVSLLTPRWSEGGDRRIVSLIQLNHGGEASCFAEVPPGAIPRQFAPATLHCAPQSTQQTVTEEDLLTSTRTHFRPIRQEVSGSSGTSVAVASSTQKYTDGTTFAIRGSLERVPYRRTDSGTLYLQQDAGTSPERYFEWRPTDTPQPGNAAPLTIPCQDTCSFVLRFRIKQNEKCCQTDENESTDDEDSSSSSIGERCVTSGEETPPPKKRVLSEPSCCDDDCELYFPGDCELLLHEQWRAGGCAQCSTGNVWGAACPACAPQVSQRRSVHRRDLRRLRDELSREGDQLLSDLQRFVLLPGAAELLPQPPVASQPHPDHRKRRHSGAPAASQRILWPTPTTAMPSQQLQSLLRPVTL